MGQELGVDFPNEYKNILSRYQDQLVIENSILNPELTIFATEDGDLWNGAVHVHTYLDSQATVRKVYMEGRLHTDTAHGILNKQAVAISNVQDFRIRDQVTKMVADFTNVLETQYSFPEQKQIIDRSMAKNSYFSEIFVTKDTNRNARFFFAFDYGKYVLESSAYADLLSKMSDAVRQQVIDNSQIVKFMIKRRQVKEKVAHNRLGSPVQNYVLSEETVEEPVILSLDDPNLNEIGLILAEQTSVPGSLLRYFTGIDTDMALKSDGFYQYFVEIEVLDGFVPIIKQMYSKLANAASDYKQYVALTQIPGVYNAESRKFTVEGMQIFADFFVNNGGSFTDNLATQAVKEYLDTLGFFVDLSVPAGPGIQYSKKDYFEAYINLLLSPVLGCVDGVIYFQDLLDKLLSQVSHMFTASHSGGGVEDTVENQPSDAPGTFKAQTSETIEYFDNTIGARFLNESYIDNVSNVLGVSGHSGLSIYSQTQLVNAIQLEENLNIADPINQTTEEILGNYGISYEVKSVKLFNTGEAMTRTGASNYLGEGYGSQAVAASASYNTLSEQDLSSPEVSINADAAFAPLITNLSLSQFEFSSQLVPKLEATKDQLQAEVDVLVGFVAPSGYRSVIRNIPTPQKGTTTTIVQGPANFTLMIREARFETKTLAQLTVAQPTTNYYLCRQTRRSDAEVVDAYFLISPANTFVDLPALTIPQDDPDFVELPESLLDAVVGAPPPQFQPIAEAQIAPSIERAFEQAAPPRLLQADPETIPPGLERVLSETPQIGAVRQALEGTQIVENPAAQATQAAVRIPQIPSVQRAPAVNNAAAQAAQQVSQALKAGQTQVVTPAVSSSPAGVNRAAAAAAPVVRRGMRNRRGGY
jgi:hypothetical protein